MAEMIWNNNSDAVSSCKVTAGKVLSTDLKTNEYFQVFRQFYKSSHNDNTARIINGTVISFPG